MIKMKRTYLLVLILFLSVSLSAQKDKQAREILDKTANALQQAGGIRATFGGTGNGTLLLKGNQFYLNSGGIQSWFDGKTQWSYLESSEEVNVSNPTPEELQTINPYALLSIYKTVYNYSICYKLCLAYVTVAPAKYVWVSCTSSFFSSESVIRSNTHLSHLLGFQGAAYGWPLLLKPEQTRFGSDPPSCGPTPVS